MIIPFDQLVKDFQLQITGVIHVGAHVGQEYVDYDKHHIKYQMYFEPCQAAFAKLIKNLPEGKDIKAFRMALGNEVGKREMYVETTNQGMSNSLLEPGTHLTTYPNIKFPKKEEVSIVKLDMLKFPRLNYNMLNMDVQGFELEVLKGAIKTLPTINIIYTEINTEEVYKGCAQVEQLDEFLSEFGFKRVYTFMACESWGDALYLKN